MSEHFKANRYRVTLEVSAYDIPGVEDLSESSVLKQICDILTGENYAIVEAGVEEVRGTK